MHFGYFDIKFVVRVRTTAIEAENAITYVNCFIQICWTVSDVI